MRFLRIIFVSLMAIGVCGGVYVGLTFGLAAYMNYEAGRLLAADEPAEAATPGTAPADAPLSAKPHAEPARSMEDAAAVLRRTWTAPRYGLTNPPPLADQRADDRKRIAPVGLRLWTPASLDNVRPKHLTFDKPDNGSPAPSTDRPPVPVDLIIAPPEAITFATGPQLKAATPDVDRVPLAVIGTNRDGNRPAATDDPTERADEALLMLKPVPPRTVPASPETLEIPEPDPYALGGVRTVLPEEDLPLTPPDRPEAVVFPVK